MTNPKFNLGEVTITFFAQLALERSGQKADEFLNQHKRGRWPEITAEEEKQNNTIIESKDGKILSAYITSMEEIIWIVTVLRKNGTQTTVLLPREFDLIEKFNIT